MSDATGMRPMRCPMPDRMHKVDIVTYLMRGLMSDGRHDLVLPQSREIFGWEADLIAVSDSGVTHEYEVMESTYDFRLNARKSIKFAVLNDESLPHPPALGRPCCFWYVTTFDIDQADIPAWAGWLSVSKVGHVVERKPATCREGLIVDAEVRRTMARLLSYRMVQWYWARAVHLCLHCGEYHPRGQTCPE